MSQRNFFRNFTEVPNTVPRNNSDFQNIFIDSANEWVDRQTDGWMDGWMYGWMSSVLGNYDKELSTGEQK